MASPFTAEQLAQMPADELACRYFYELDEDPDGDTPPARALQGEADRRGLGREQLLALWDAQHDVG